MTADRRASRSLRAAFVTLCVSVVPAPSVLAQTVPPAAGPTSRPARTDHQIELTISGTWTGPISFGSSNATLEAPDGSTLILFKSSSRLSPGGGLEVGLGFHVAKKLGAEISGSWTRSEIRTDLSADFEGATPITATVGTSRYTIEGAALWTVAQHGRARWFVRGSVGWMRELDETQALTKDGTIANIGGGVKYWWREQPRGLFRKLGLRVEARASIRSAGLSLDQRSPRVAPVVAGGLIIGF